MAQVTGAVAPISTSALLAFFASYVDTVSFVGLFSLFIAHVTGNLVVVAAALLGQVQQLPAKLLALPVFVAAVALAQLINLGHPNSPRRAALVLLGAETVLLIGSMAVAVRAEPLVSAHSRGLLTVALMGVFAMGLQNALGHLPLFKGLSPTTSMTGNLTEATMDFVDVIVGSAVDRGCAVQRLVGAWVPIFAFALGAAAAVLGFAAFGFWCLVAPILLLPVVAALLVRWSTGIRSS